MGDSYHLGSKMTFGPQNFTLILYSIMVVKFYVRPTLSDGDCPCLIRFDATVNHCVQYKCLHCIVFYCMVTASYYVILAVELAVLTVFSAR